VTAIASSEASIAGLVGSLALDTLIPDAYAPYRRAVVDATAFFLSRLSAHRLAEIVAAQRALPSTAGPAVRAVTLVHCCPTLHKLGQVLARHRSIIPGFRAQLQRLESMEPTTSMTEVAAILHDELGGAVGGELLLGAPAIAEASVAVVVPFTVRASPAATTVRGVLKVLKPGIERALLEELEVWPQVGAFLDDACERFGIPALEYQATLDDVRDLLVEEVHLEHEQRHLVEAAEAYADMDRVRVPSLLPYCSPRVTAMSRIDGPKVTSVTHWPPERRRGLAELVVRALICRPTWSVAPTALFHADPHAGNLVAMDDGSLGILDWSLIGRLGKPERIHIAQIVLGALSLDPARVCQAVAALAAHGPDQSRLRSVVEDSLRSLRRGALPGLEWLVRLLDAAVARAGVRLGRDLMLFRKVLLTLEGVVDDVCADFPVDQCLVATAVAQLASEWPRRMVSAPFSRAHGTHVSNVDLASLVWSWPATAMRLLSGVGSDVLRSARAGQLDAGAMPDAARDPT
jgi:ubiquinone biosynthesis protein